MGLGLFRGFPFLPRHSRLLFSPSPPAHLAQKDYQGSPDRRQRGKRRVEKWVKWNGGRVKAIQRSIDEKKNRKEAPTPRRTDSLYCNSLFLVFVFFCLRLRMPLLLLLLLLRLLLLHVRMPATDYALAPPDNESVHSPRTRRGKWENKNEKRPLLKKK